MKKNLKHLLAAASAALMSLILFTGCMPTATAEDGSTASGTGSYMSIIMIVVLIAVFYFFMIRPEQKKKKKTEEMRNSLGVGDKITTIGGIVGKIKNLF